MEKRSAPANFDDLFYPGTQTLVNLFDERDPVKLASLERATTTAVEIATRLGPPINGDFDIAHMQALHKHLFGQVYPWAGDIRTYPIFKQRPDHMVSEFARPTEFPTLDKSLNSAVQALRGQAGKGIQNFPDQIAKIYQIVNEYHPFRDGNGRTQRLYLDNLAKLVGYRLQYDKVSPTAWNYAASMATPISVGNGERVPGRPDELRKVFEHISVSTKPELNNAYSKGRAGQVAKHDRPVLALSDLNPSLATYGARNRIR